MIKFPNVSKFEKELPQGYRLGVDGWGFPQEKLEEKLEDGTRKLLTLDVSISPDGFVKKVNSGSEDLQELVKKNYKDICTSNCKYCFERDGPVTNYVLSWDENKKILEEAKDLGLESVKFLGPGELIANPDLFKILDYFQDKGIKIGIFTHGHILENDKLAMKYQGMDTKQLAKKLASYDVVRMLIHYTANKAVELFAKEGLNKDPSCQRMSLQTNPVTAYNIDEIFDYFKWGTERNIPVCVTPTMVSGAGRKFVKQAQEPEFQEKLIQLYTDIYLYLIDKGIMTLEQLEKEGVSSYAGMQPCNQLSSGMFIRKDGVVQQCPGNDYDGFVIDKDIRKKPLKEIWKNSANYKRGPEFNNKCVKDGYSITCGLYGEVLDRVKAAVGKC